VCVQSLLGHGPKDLRKPPRGGCLPVQWLRIAGQRVIITSICRLVLNRICRLLIRWGVLVGKLPLCFGLCLCLSVSCWLQPLRPISHVNTRVLSPAPPKLLTDTPAWMRACVNRCNPEARPRAHSPAHTHSHSVTHTHTLTRSLTHSSFSHAVAHSITITIAITITHTLTQPTHSLTHSLTHPLTHSWTHESIFVEHTHSCTCHHTPTYTGHAKRRAEQMNVCSSCCFLAHVPCAIPNPQLPGELRTPDFPSVPSASDPNDHRSQAK